MVIADSKRPGYKGQAETKKPSANLAGTGELFKPIATRCLFGRACLFYLFVMLLIEPDLSSLLGAYENRCLQGQGNAKTEFGQF